MRTDTGTGYYYLIYLRNVLNFMFNLHSVLSSPLIGFFANHVMHV